MMIAYMTVFNGIKKLIESGAYEIGAMLPPEHALEELYGVSRITVRRAVKMLVDEGYVIIKPGKGTMVADRSVTQRLNYISSFTKSLMEKGHAVALKSFRVDLLTDPEIAEALRIGPSDAIARVKRIITSDGKPIASIVNWYPHGIVRGIESFDGSVMSLYELLGDRVQFSIDKATDSVTAINADEELAGDLEVPAGTALLKNNRIAYRKGEPVEYAVTITNPKLFSYVFNMVAPQSLQR